MGHTPFFGKILSSYDIYRFDADPDVIYGVDADLRIGFLNRAWYRFAEQNQGEPDISERFGLGSCILDSISGPLLDFHRTALPQALFDGKPWETDYECSSADVFRKFHQRAYPLEKHALLIVNSLLVERPHDPKERPPHPAVEGLYLNDDGLIRMCGHCRRVQRLQPPAQWDWVPDWVRVCPPNTSHGLCGFCLEYYFPVGADPLDYKTIPKAPPQ